MSSLEPIDSCEQTRQKILFHLEEAIKAAAQPREFHIVIGPLVSAQEAVLDVVPGEDPEPSMRRRSVFDGFKANLRKADWLAWIALVMSILGGLLSLITTLAQKYAVSGSLIVGTALAATGPRTSSIDPNAAFVFHIVIALMVPVFAIGAFLIVIYGSTPEVRKTGKGC